MQNRVEQRRRGVARERPGARGHLVQHYAEREQIGARVQFLSQRLLRRHVRHGSHRRARIGEHLFGGCIGGQGGFWTRAFRRHLGQTKIQNLGLPAACDEDVRRLDVAMHDSLDMRSVQRISDLNRDLQLLIGLQRFSGDCAPAAFVLRAVPWR